MTNVYELIFFLYIFMQLQNSITIYYCFYTIFFKFFSAYINHIYTYYNHIPQKFEDFFISSFFSLYSLSTLSFETNSSWLIYESIKILEIKTSIAFIFFFIVLFLNNWFTYFNSCSYHENFCCYCRTSNFYRNTSERNKTRNKNRTIHCWNYNK